MKIYNEIVIDMNPESSSFEEVIYEDSYNYSGDVDLLRELKPGDGGNMYDLVKDKFLDEKDVQRARDLGMENLAKDIQREISGQGGSGASSMSSYNVEAAEKGQVDYIQQGTTEVNLPQGNTTSPLPSMPAISNVGTVPFSGSVNWNAIPGGFQPLPQTAGSRKRLYQLSQFHGGVNQKASPRDIGDNESIEAQNISFSNIGRILALGDCLNADNNISSTSSNSVTAVANQPAPGFGLFQFTAPVDQDAVAGTEVITLVGDGSQVDAYSQGGGSDTGWMDMVHSGSGSDDDGNVAHLFYAAGNGVYSSDASFRYSRRAKIYVNRKDFNGLQTTKGWVEGKALIDSPKFDTTQNTAGTVSLDWDDKAAGSDVDFPGSNLTSTYGATTVHIGADGDVTGTWNGNYYFYISWIFDGGAETGLTSIVTTGGTVPTFSNESLAFNFSCKAQWNGTDNHIGMDTGGSYSAGEPRIEGARIYFGKDGDNERYLLAEVNLVDGIKGALDSTYTPWKEATNVFYLETNLKFTAPPAVYTYSALNGYYANEVYDKSSSTSADGDVGPVAHELYYKAVTVGQNGTVFLGNIGYRGVEKRDTMIFSMPGKPGVFPEFNTFDSPSSDGSPITALASFQDTILQFKENALYIINISNPAQFYAEASYRDCGVYNPCQVFTTSFGVIFANNHGCFVYDGNKVTSLTSGKFDSNDWDVTDSSYIDLGDDANVPCIGYDPRAQCIIVLKDIGDNSVIDDAWIYDMATQSWTEGKEVITNAAVNRHTNFLITSEGYLSIKRHNDSSGTADDAILNFTKGTASSNNQKMLYQTKDFDFGLPSQTKFLFKVYVTYKGNPSNLTLNYRVDGNSTDYGFNATNWDDAGTDDYETAEFIPDSSSERKDWASMSLIFSSGSNEVSTDLEINDITIVYRARPIK